MYLGQRVMPRGHDLRADAPDATRLAAELTRVREIVQSTAFRMPTHEDFIAQYCPATRPANPGAMA